MRCFKCSKEFPFPFGKHVTITLTTSEELFSMRAGELFLHPECFREESGEKWFNALAGEEVPDNTQSQQYANNNPDDKS